MNQKEQPNSNQRKLTQVTECMPKYSILTRKIRDNLGYLHPGVLATKVGYFGVKLTKVPLGADGHQTC